MRRHRAMSDPESTAPREGSSRSATSVHQTITSIERLAAALAHAWTSTPSARVHARPRPEVSYLVSGCGLSSSTATGGLSSRASTVSQTGTGSAVAPDRNSPEFLNLPTAGSRADFFRACAARAFGQGYVTDEPAFSLHFGTNTAAPAALRVPRRRSGSARRERLFRIPQQHRVGRQHRDPRRGRDDRGHCRSNQQRDHDGQRHDRWCRHDFGDDQRSYHHQRCLGDRFGDEHGRHEHEHEYGRHEHEHEYECNISKHYRHNDRRCGRCFRYDGGRRGDDG